jgi:cell division protease FtsH
MNEVRRPKKSLIYYYIIMLLIITLFNVLAMPLLSQGKVREVDYGTFIRMTEEKKIDRVEVQASQIVFTAKGEDLIYITGKMDDPDLTRRLYAAGATFSTEIVKEMSPF